MEKLGAAGEERVEAAKIHRELLNKSALCIQALKINKTKCGAEEPWQ